MNKYFSTLLLLFICVNHHVSLSQDFRVISWQGIQDYTTLDTCIKLIDFENSVFIENSSFNKIYFERIPVPSKNIVFEIYDVEFDSLNQDELKVISKIDLESDIVPTYNVVTERKKHYLYFYFVPFIVKQNVVQKVKSFKFRFVEKEDNLINKKRLIENSILSTGNWYKIGVTQSGLYEMDKIFLSSMGIDVSDIDPKYIRLYGNKAGVIQEGFTDVDDLIELSIKVHGGDDGFFDEADKILFFGESPHIWKHNGEEFSHITNSYTDTTYYFLNLGDFGLGKRVDLNSDLNNETIDHAVFSYDDYFFHEQDLVNPVKTGRDWLGESFSFDQNQLFSYNSPYIDLNMPVHLKVKLAARSFVGTTFNISNNSNDLLNIYIPSVTLSTNDYYKTSFVEHSFLPSSSNLSLSFNTFNTEQAWLDYFSMVFRSHLIFDGTQFLFRDSQSVGTDMTSKFFIDTSISSSNLEVWDVSDVSNIRSMNLIEQDTDCFFITSTDVLKEFLVFDNTDNLTPFFSKMVPNQNLHATDQPDYVIITSPEFLSSASRLRDYHTSKNNMIVLLVTTDQVYNEFSTGSQDISAIRNMMKMFYDRDLDKIPKNLLLFGDASFDYKNKLGVKSNYVPTYESITSNNIETSYCTDDYFVVLDDSEGFWNGGISTTTNLDLIDVGVGRIPVVTVEEAESFVDKIILYDSSSRGDWKNNICFVADDADAGWEVNLITHADALAEKIDTTYNYFNIDKIYLDSYPQSLLSGAQRYPEAQQDLVNLIKNGVFIVNYVGHGGEVGWASERILELSDINNFDNLDKLPVFITATCEFTRYDDPTRVSAGEYLIKNPNGGAIGLYSTSRTVAESPTYNLVNALYNYLPDRNLNLSFGESLMYSKNDPLSGFNSIKRKFSFFGDPNLKLSHPELTINTLSIQLLDSLNQIIPSQFDLNHNDTIQSLSHVRVMGEVVSEPFNLFTDFSGILDVTVFDKESIFNTLNNDGFLETPFEYSLQKNVIYNGKVEVISGQFVFEFIVPKDINYSYGNGKLSYYAYDESMGDEAVGVYQDILVGGVSDNMSLDLVGPEIQLFLNNLNFVSGGTTNNSPKLLALLFDESGINTVGTGIGHDLTVILDENTSNQYILNDYYESDLNSYQSGQVLFPFLNLSDGEHTLTFKAWDVHNNSSTATLDFFVTSVSELSLADVFNYPNPATSFTRFVFEHNRPDQLLDIRIDIFSLNGELIKTISSKEFSTGFRNESLTWSIDDSVERGIYIYRVIVKSEDDNSISEKTEKLIILR